MSVALEISTAQDCGGKLFFFFEETGQYNFLSNPTGYGVATNTASVTNNTIGTGTQNYVVGLNLAIYVGDTIVIYPQIGFANYMTATVVAYNAITGSLDVLVTAAVGAGVFASWYILYAGGEVNPSTTEVASAIITVTNPAGGVYTINPFSLLPSNNPLFGYAINGTDIGLSAGVNIPDGVYTIKYTITGSFTFSGASFSYTTSIQQLFDCNVQCCINEKMTTLNAGCGCNKNNNAVELYTLLESARAAAKCGKAEKAQAIIDYLTTICSTDCGGCN